MPEYVIKGTQLVDDSELDYDDKMDIGEYGKGGLAFEAGCTADDEEAALDDFHSIFPIAVLEDYEIETEEVG